MRKRGIREQLIHQAVVKHLETRGAPGVVFLHPANGGWRRPTEGAILKSMGVLKGAPDIFLFHGGRTFALELKAPGGSITDAQERCLIALRAAGVEATHVHGLDQAIATLERWGLLLGRADLARGAV